MTQERRRYYQPEWSHHATTQRFAFATGIECSYPTITVVGDDGRRTRRRIDQLEKCDHYGRWREDLALTRELGVRYLRWGAPYHRMHLAPGRYDWSFTDEVLPEIRRLGIIPIVDLCHFGVPDWLGSFQSPDFPPMFAEFARAFANRYPWIFAYTPVNEMYIAALFSGFYGWWNEEGRTHETFVTALKHLARAQLDAMLAIIQEHPSAIFVLCESSEHTHAQTPDLVDEAEMQNALRFLALDLVSARHIDAGMYAYLCDHGVTEDEYDYFQTHNLREHLIIGHDYYRTCEHMMVDPERRRGAGDLLGYYAIARSYHARYELPVMHTETHAPEPDASTWLWKTWAQIQQLRLDGIPVCGMTWYSLVDQIDWDTALREENGRVWPIGLFDLDRRERPVGRAYRTLVRDWRTTPFLPNGPLTVLGGWAGPFDT
ncbi:family 1 glycosylhydrolase [Myxococcota bacterium]|nr:family 1 glycosylhydrolase [Myxococcota bacterium]